MRSLFALGIALALATGTLSGCGGGPEDGRTVVRIWHQKDGAERDFFRSEIEAFNATQDTIRVEELYKETEELRNHFTFAAIGGKGPDLIYGPADNVGILGLTETIRPLTGLLDEAFLEGFSEDGVLTWDDEPVVVTDQVGNHLAFVYNRALMPEPPETLDELVRMGRELTEDTDGDGRPDRYGLTWNYTEPFFFIPFLTAHGGWVMDSTATPTLDNAATSEAIEFVLALRDEHAIIPRESDYNVAETLFKEGRAAAIINGPWAWAGYQEAGIDIGIARIPRNGETGVWAAPMVSAKGYAVNRAIPEEREAAVATVLRHFTGSEMQTAMARELATIPTRRDVLQSPVMDENPILAMSQEQAAVGRAMPTAPQLRQVWDGMRGPYQLVMNGAVSPEEGAALMQSETEKRIADTFLGTTPEGPGADFWLILLGLVAAVGVYVWWRRTRSQPSAAPPVLAH